MTVAAVAANGAGVAESAEVATAEAAAESAEAATVAGAAAPTSRGGTIVRSRWLPGAARPEAALKAVAIRTRAPIAPRAPSESLAATVHLVAIVMGAPIAPRVAIVRPAETVPRAQTAAGGPIVVRAVGGTSATSAAAAMSRASGRSAGSRPRTDAPGWRAGRPWRMRDCEGRHPPLKIGRMGTKVVEGAAGAAEVAVAWDAEPEREREPS